MTLTMFVVYDRPRDYPAHIVVRAWHVSAGKVTPDGEPSLYPNIDAARAQLEARALQRLERSPDDDPAIKEVWL